MRGVTKQAFATIVALLGVLALSSAASAISIELEWSGSGTNLTGWSFTGSETVTLEVYAVVTNPPGLDGLGLSIKWNSDLLSLVSCTPANTTVAQYVAGGSFQPFNKGAGATCDNPGSTWQPALTQLANWHPYAPYGPGKLHVADLQFHVTGMGGNLVVRSFFNPLADGWADNNFTFSLNAVFGSAWIVPEPTTAMLVGLGFIGLLAASNRRRRSA
jgi:hypothetical protein